MRHAREDYNRIQDPEGKIPEDEPVFLLRARDCTAWMAVNDYANRLEKHGGDQEIIRLAREHALRMRHWKDQEMPVLPKGEC